MILALLENKRGGQSARGLLPIVDICSAERKHRKNNMKFSKNKKIAKTYLKIFIFYISYS